MEFGLFIQNYVPNMRRATDPDAEHTVIMEDLDLIKAADRAGFKYCWLTEHHFLDEYSHLSANDVACGYLAACTERIHIGSGIFNPLPQVNHPVKVAERVAYLDHLSGGRFEFGTGRGAGTHEILGFLPGMRDLTHTREIWEDVIGEFKKMWLQDTYEGYDGAYWSLPPRKVLPKPWGGGHPAMWYAAGNTSSYEMAARKGLGVLGFSVGDYDALAPVVEAYKGAIGSAEPVGAFVNDNVMITTAAFVDEDEQTARNSVLNSSINYLQSNVFRYHDTFPHPPEIPKWPELIPAYTPEALDWAVNTGMVCGTPDQALAQCRRWEAAGADQLVFGCGMSTKDEMLKTIALLGEHVIPKVDTDPEHSTTRYRRMIGNHSR